MSDLEKTKNMNMPTKTLLPWLRNYTLFLNIKLDRNKTISIFMATVELAKIKHV